MNEGYFEDRGLYYRTNNFVPGRPTLVFMHGLSGSSSAWLRHEKLFEHTHNILSFDLRGHGRSRKHPHYEDYTIPKFADDLFQLVLHLKIDQFALITHSFGCLIALEFLAKHQDRVTSALLLSPNFAVGKRVFEKIVRPFFAITKIFNIFPIPPKPGTHVDYTRHEEANDWNIPMTYDDVRNTSLRVYLYASRQAFAVDYHDLLPLIHIPVVLVHGKNDSIFPIAHSRIMNEKMKNSKFILLDGADHIIVVNHFDKISKILEDFVLGLARKE